MKRKLSLFLALCLMLGSISPALEAKAASVQQEEVQLVTEEEAETIEVTEELTESTDEELSTEDAADQEEPSNETETPEITDEPETPTEGEVPSEEGETSEDVIVPEGGEVTEEPEDVLAEEVLPEETVPEEEPISEEEITEEVIIEEVEEVQEIEEKDTSADTAENGKFSGTWGADNTDVAVTAYSYGADLLIARKGTSYSLGTMGTEGVLIVESSADVDLTVYADGTTLYDTGMTSSPYSLAKPLKVADVAEGTAMVRYIPLERTSSYSNNIDGTNYFCTYMMSVTDLEPATEYDYLLVEFDSSYNSTNKTYDMKLTQAVESDETAIQRNFVTAPVTDEVPEVQINSFEAGYTRIRSELEVSGLNGQKLLEIGTTSDTSGDEVYGSNPPIREYESAIKTDNLPASLAGTMRYYAWKDKLSNKANHPFEPEETSKSVTPYIVVRTYTESGYVDTRYEGTSVMAERQDISNVNLKSSRITNVTDTKVTIASAFTNISVESDLYYKIQYRPVGDETWKTNYSPYSAYLNGAESSISLTSLTAGTEYEYDILLCNSNGSEVLKTLDGGTFTTETLVTLTKEDIPDPALWKYFAGDAESVSSLILLNKNSITLAYNDIATYGMIKDLTGLEYCKNLKSISINSHGITDLTPILACKNLTSVQFYANNLTTVPDFSGLTALTFINVNGNRITNEELEKLPVREGLTVNKTGQRPAVAIGVESTILARESSSADTYEMNLRIENASTYDYTLDVKVEDITSGEDQAVVLCENTSLDAENVKTTYEEYNGTGYTITATVSGLALEEGNCTLRVTWADSGKIYTQDFEVTADADAVGANWNLSEEELPSDIKGFLLSKYSYSKYDANNDGEFSYAELAKIQSFEIYDESVQLSNFDFLKYFIGLNDVYISYQTGLTDDVLEKICAFDSFKGVTYLSLENMSQITSLDAIASNVKDLEILSLDSMQGIKDISALASLGKLRQLNMHFMENIAGLPALKKLPFNYLYAESGTFSDADIFEFICNKTSVEVKAGHSVSLVSTIIEMEDSSNVTVAVENEGIAGVAEEDKFTLYGFSEGTTNVTISYGNSSYTIGAKTTMADFDSDPAVGEAVSTEDLMNFAGTEGVLNARFSRTLVDVNENIWNITSKTPEKVLGSSDYAKYASRILPWIAEKFCADTPSGAEEYAFYLDEEGTLWAYTKNIYSGDSNFHARTILMKDVADWQDGGYFQEQWHSSEDEYLLVLRKDGSLWYVGYNYQYETFHNEMVWPDRFEKIEEAGRVKSIHPHSYLTNDGEFWHTEATRFSETDKWMVADNVENVWDNTAVAIAQDSEGVYYNDCGRLDMTGTKTDFLVTSYYNPACIAHYDDYSGYSTGGSITTYGGGDDSYMTGIDMLASVILMSDGKLYISNHSSEERAKEWSLLDSNVTSVEKDYYWKGDTAYAYSGEKYAQYIGNGAGRGLYPVKQSNGTMALYVNGVRYLTEVVDWTWTDDCVYAIRKDNTLWQFDEENYPAQVDMSVLNNTIKTKYILDKDIQIEDLRVGVDYIELEWTAIAGATSYNLWTGVNSEEDQYVCQSVSGNTFKHTGLEQGNDYWYRIEAVNAAGDVIADYYDFYVCTKMPTLTLNHKEATLGTSSAELTIDVTVGPSDLSGSDYKLQIKMSGGYSIEADPELGESGIPTEKSWSESYDFECSGGGRYSLRATEIPLGTSGSGDVYLYKNNKEMASCYFNFDTEPHLYLTEKEIPDAAFREILRNYSSELDLYALQKKTHLEIDDASIQDLTGLELLTGLTNLTLKGINPDIIDTSKFSAGLEYLYMTSCGLKEIPDLSGLPELKYLDLSSNEIPESEFTADNAALKTFVINYKEYYGADSLEYWLEEQKMSQLGDPVIYVSDVYYQTTTGSYPFLIEVAKVDGTHEYKLELYDGTKLTASLNEASGAGSGRIGFKIADAGISSAGEKELTYVVTDVTEGKEVCRETKKITYKASWTPESEKRYIPTTFWSQYIRGISLSQEQFDTLYNTGWNKLSGYESSFGPNGILTDAAGKELPASCEVERNRSYPEEYDIFRNVPSLYLVYNYQLYTDILEGDEMHTLAPGACTLTVYGYDGKTAAIQLKDVIEVTSSAIINGVGTEREQFDIQGEYLYVGVYGDQLGKEPINMTITDKNGNNVSSKPYELVYAYSPTWKIHLDEAYRETSNFYYEITDEGLLGETSGSFYVNRQNGYLYNLYGDDLKKELVGYASSALKDGTELSFVFYEDDGTEYKTVNATVKNREIHVPFTPGEENNYISNYRVEVYDDEEQLLNKRISNGNIYNGDNLSFSTKRVNYVRYFGSIIEVTGKAVIELRDPKDYHLLTTLETTEDREFTDMDLSAVEGGKLYYVVAKDDDSYAVRMGYFNVVTETNNLTFALTDHNGNAITAANDNKYLVNYTSDMKGKVLALDVSTIGNGQAVIKAASSNAKVAAAKVSGKTVNLTVKAVGTTNITVTALDSDYSETVTLEFRDHTPKFDSTTVSINKALRRTEAVNVYPVYGTELREAVIDETKLTTKEVNAGYAKYFNVAVDGNSIHVGLNDTEKETPLKNGSYRLPLTITVDDKTVPAVLKVKLTNTKPKVTVKQDEKINLFYTDTKSVLTLSSNIGEISSVSLVNEESDTVFFKTAKQYDVEKGTIELTPKSYEALKALTSKELSNALKIQLNITVGETTLTQKVTLSKATTKPSVSLSQASSKVYKVTDGDETFYIGKVLNFAPIDKKTKKVLEDVNVTLTGYSVTKKGVTTQNFSPTATPSGEMPEEGFVLNANTDESFTIYFVGNTTATATLMVQGDNWSEAIKTTYKVTVTTSKLSGKLATTKVSLNQKYAEDQKTVLVSAALPYESFELGKWTITQPKKSNYDEGDILIDKNAEGTGLTVSLKAKEESLKGTYKASIPVTFTFFDGTQYTPKNLSLTITVLDELLTAKALKWKTSGKLNTIDRENGVVTLTPTVSKVNAAVSHVMFSEADKAENVALDQKLDMKVVDGKVVVSLLPGVDVSTKDKYIIHPVVTLANEDGTDFTTLEAPAVTLKPTQASVKATLTPKQATMYQYATGTHTAVFDYTLKATEGVKVKDVVLTNMTEYFEVEHDSENQQIIVTLKDSSVAVKTHTLKLQITFEDQATNAKPLSVSAKVAVKK